MSPRLRSDLPCLLCVCYVCCVRLKLMEPPSFWAIVISILGPSLGVLWKSWMTWGISWSKSGVILIYLDPTWLIMELSWDPSRTNLSLSWVVRAISELFRNLCRDWSVPEPRWFGGACGQCAGSKLAILCYCWSYVLMICWGQMLSIRAYTCIEYALQAVIRGSKWKKT